MASMAAMFSGLSGLSSNAQRLDVIGNNIANVNTTAFKSNRIQFGPIFSRNFSLGTAPSANNGGTNPVQVGLGTSIAGTQRNFANGTISPTGVTTDLAIEGDGFFVVQFGGERFYTRAGSFERNAANDLVALTGARVLGHPVDSQFNIVSGQLVPLNIPIGSMTLAEATRAVALNGNLNASGPIATTGSVHQSAPMFSGVDELSTSEMTGTENLVTGTSNIYRDGDPTPVLAIEAGANTVITVSGIEKAGQNLGTHQFGFMTAATAAARGITHYGSTMNDFVAFLENVMGLSDADFNGQSLGGSISINANGEIIITGNEGTVQDLRVVSAQITATNDNNTGMFNPFTFARTGEANGESVRTSFVVYDSLGTPLTVDLSFVLQATTPNGGSTWMFLAESADHAAAGRIVGQGIVQFDSDGQLLSSTDSSLTISRNNGATSPFTFDLTFNSGADAVSALTNNQSNVSASWQDGSPMGTLSNFAIGTDGIITGAFTNGLTRTIGQIALATFTNPEGLVDVGNNLFSVGINSGTAILTTPGEFGTGRVIGGALELSNVDLSQEFINMIMASTGYSASSRVISTTNELLQQLLVVGR